jgi:hypothetical protein
VPQHAVEPRLPPEEALALLVRSDVRDWRGIVERQPELLSEEAVRLLVYATADIPPT